MSNVLNFPDRERRFDEASLWIARIDRGLTEKEKELLAKWFNQSPENGQTLLELAALWDKMDRLSLLSEVFHVQPKRQRSNAWIRYSLASCFFILLSGILINYIFMPSSSDVSYTTDIYSTSVGEQRKVSLQDGSTLILNTDTEVKVHFSEKQRLLLLTRGEIHIDVEHDAARPLRVAARDKIVQAVGTAFDVRILESMEVKLWVTEGRVLVVDGRGIIDPDPFREILLPKDGMSISKGEKAVLSDTNHLVEKMSEGDISTRQGWRQGNIVFRGETLDEAILEFNRYSDSVFVIHDESLKTIRIAGVFKIGESTTNLLSTLKNNFSIHHEYTNDNKILLMATIASINHEM